MHSQKKHIRKSSIMFGVLGEPTRGAQAGPKVGPRRAQAGPKLGPSWAQAGPKPGPSWAQAGPKLGSQKIPKTKILEIEIRVTQNVGKVWISRKKSSWPHLGPSGHIFCVGRKMHKMVKIWIFPWLLSSMLPRAALTSVWTMSLDVSFSGEVLQAVLRWPSVASRSQFKSLSRSLELYFAKDSYRRRKVFLE